MCHARTGAYWCLPALSTLHNNRSMRYNDTSSIATCIVQMSSATLYRGHLLMSGGCNRSSATIFTLPHHFPTWIFLEPCNRERFGQWGLWWHHETNAKAGECESHMFPIEKPSSSLTPSPSISPPLHQLSMWLQRHQSVICQPLSIRSWFMSAFVADYKAGVTWREGEREGEGRGEKTVRLKRVIHFKEIDRSQSKLNLYAVLRQRTHKSFLDG